MTRLQVFGLRLLPTAFVIGVVLTFVYGLWYPGGYPDLAGIGRPVALMVVIGLVIGPGLTALVYRPGKRGLVSDIAVIALLELLAVGLMTTALYQRQPAYTVFAVDRFEVVSRAEIDDRAFADRSLARRPAHAPRLVFAAMPTDPAVFDRLLDETVLMGLPDIDRRPEFWRRYPAGLDVVREAARPLTALAAAGPSRREAVAAWLDAAGRAAAGVLFVPVRGRRGDGAMLIDALTGYPIEILDVDPWLEESAAQDGPPARDVEQAHQ